MNFPDGWWIEVAPARGIRTWARLPTEQQSLADEVKSLQYKHRMRGKTAINETLSRNRCDISDPFQGNL